MNKEDEFEVIFAYTRAQAIADGVLVDVTDTAKEAGFRIPVALTSSVWAEYVKVPEGVEGQDEAGRLWDVLNMLRFAIERRSPSLNRPGGGSTLLRFWLHVRNTNEEGEPPLVELKAVCGPNDDASPCLTIMRIDED
jgi:hypothetical protein